MKSLWLALAAAALLSLPAAAMRPVLLEDQGSFFAGGTVRTAEGVYRGNEDARDLSGETLHGDHAYVFWQRPAHARTMALVFLHGAGQSGKTWETTPDGRDGFQNIFLEKGYATYVVDQPRPRPGRPVHGAGDDLRRAGRPALVQQFPHRRVAGDAPRRGRRR